MAISLCDRPYFKGISTRNVKNILSLKSKHVNLPFGYTKGYFFPSTAMAQTLAISTGNINVDTPISKQAILSVLGVLKILWKDIPLLFVYVKIFFSNIFGIDVEFMQYIAQM